MQSLRPCKVFHPHVMCPSLFPPHNPDDETCERCQAYCCADNYSGIDLNTTFALSEWLGLWTSHDRDTRQAHACINVLQDTVAVCIFRDMLDHAASLKACGS
jgi:hypothetical protein